MEYEIFEDLDAEYFDEELELSKQEPFECKLNQE